MKLPIKRKLSHSMEMRKSITSIIMAITSGIIAFTISDSVQAQSEKGFVCDLNSGVPTTTYLDGRGTSEPWIKWVSEHFSEAKWTPKARCETVSERLEQYRQEGKLKYVTLGIENNQQIICVASRDNGPCEGIVYTLKPGQNGISALNNLFAWGSGQQNLESSYESSTAIPYINVGERLSK